MCFPKGNIFTNTTKRFLTQFVEMLLGNVKFLTLNVQSIVDSFLKIIISWYSSIGATSNK